MAACDCHKKMQKIDSGDDFLLHSGDTTARVLTPWSRYYQRTRFTHAAFITQVWRNNVCYTAGEAEGGNARNCGMGLCCEYKGAGLDENVPVGEPWLKPGIGAVRRETEPWQYTSSACTDTPYGTLAASDDEAIFEYCSPNIRGDAYAETRCIRIEPGCITQTITFRNTGATDWNLMEYCHNFLSLNGRKTDRHHHLVLPALHRVPGKPDDSGVTETWVGLDWSCTPRTPKLFRFYDVCDASFAWLLYCDDSPLSVWERISEKPTMMQVWEDERLIAPEAFVAVQLQPGEEKSWSCQWFFGK